MLAGEKVVTEEALELRLAALIADAQRDLEGAFGPASMRWHIDREAALFLGAGRALLLQLAHPWVAAAVVRHSLALDDPVARFHRTFGAVFAMIFGRFEEALAAARALHRRHAAITGSIPRSAGRYAANDRAALYWVHATLVDSALAAYALVLPLAPEDRDRYYGESRRFASFFGLGPDETPPDYTAFSRDCAAMVSGGSLAVGPEARTIAARLLAGAGRVPVPAWYRALTAEMLPAPLASAYGLPRGAGERRRANAALAVIRRAYRHLPPRLRFVGPYHEARERLSGRRPSRPTRWANRLWIGRPTIGA